MQKNNESENGLNTGFSGDLLLAESVFLGGKGTGEPCIIDCTTVCGNHPQPFGGGFRWAVFSRSLPSTPGFEKMPKIVEPFLKKGIKNRRRLFEVRRIICENNTFSENPHYVF